MLARSAAVDHADAKFLHVKDNKDRGPIARSSEARFSSRFMLPSPSHIATAGARRGVLTTPHGVVETPAFMPVGTQGAVKAMTPRDLEELGAEIILGNTYHLHLRPGDELIARRGGLHRFIGWTRPILTDSGGYQVFSLARGARSRRGRRVPVAPRRQRVHLLTPERPSTSRRSSGRTSRWCSTSACASPATDVARESMELTARWARARARALSGARVRRRRGRRHQPGQAQFGIVQGGTFPGSARPRAPRPTSRSGSRATRSAA